MTAPPLLLPGICSASSFLSSPTCCPPTSSPTSRQSDLSSGPARRWIQFLLSRGLVMVSGRSCEFHAGMRGQSIVVETLWISHEYCDIGIDPSGNKGRTRELTASLCKPHSDGTRTSPRCPANAHDLPNPIRKQPPSSQTPHCAHRRPHTRVNPIDAQPIQQSKLREVRAIPFSLLRGTIGVQGGLTM